MPAAATANPKTPCYVRRSTSVTARSNPASEQSRGGVTPVAIFLYKLGWPRQAIAELSQ